MWALALAVVTSRALATTCSPGGIKERGVSWPDRGLLYAGAVKDDDDLDTAPIDWRIDPANVQAATATLARLLKLLGAQDKDPGALFGLHALIGATLLQFTEYTAGQMIDQMHAYADDEKLIDAVTLVLRKEGIIESDPGSDDASHKPN